MKTKKLIILGILLYFAGTSCTLTAQTVEKRVGNTVYVVDTVKRVMENKENKLSKLIESYSDECPGAVSSPREFYYEEYKKVFSEKRAKELESLSILYRFTCDSTGLIKEIRYDVQRENLNKITLLEFKALEEHMKQVRVHLSSWCPGKEYYYFYHAVVFRRLYGEK